MTTDAERFAGALFGAAMAFGLAFVLSEIRRFPPLDRRRPWWKYAVVLGFAILYAASGAWLGMKIGDRQTSRGQSIWLGFAAEALLKVTLETIRWVAEELTEWWNRGRTRT